jgi:glutathione S-transferase|eukprot:TRINITY_DN3522_c0_g1_i1.p1 TRINITY_DN3522_c0_g1~~TRINITY_DN3522_c0_g1_i1.p1  ORF type:complete len:189 (+),score=43.20 TRINITY_DN3522_c0_g1_i1:31-567(+)
MAAIAKTLAKGMVPAVFMAWGELRLAAALDLPMISLAIPRAFAAVIVANGILPAFILAYLSAKVGHARQQFKVDYPTMYTSGQTDDERTFNCVQRGHQHALESYPQFAVLSLIGGVRHPLTTAIAGIVWSIARIKWAQGYATGDPSRRYESSWGRMVWYSLVVTVTTAGSSALALLGL